MKKLVALLTAAFMLAALTVPAMAADDFKYTAVNGTYTLFDKYLVIDDEAAVPDLVFDYTVTGVAKQSATPGSTFEIIDTESATMPTMYQVTDAEAARTATAPAEASAQKKLTFVKNEAKTAVKAQDDWLDLPTGKNFVKRIMKVDFTGVSFDEPGIYRYEIEEQQIAGRTDISYDTQASTPGVMKRYLDVYVTDGENKELVVSSYVFHENKSAINATDEYGSINDNATGWTFANGTQRDTLAAAEADAVNAVVDNGDDTFTYGETTGTKAEAEAAAKADVKVTAVKLDDKSQGYVNELATYDLEFGKEVEGNQGSKDKYFKYTVKIEGLAENTVLQLDVETKADKTPQANSATKYTAADMKTANEIDEDQTADGQQLKAPAGGTIEKTFYLQDGQYIGIKGLPVGAVYTITEDAEDYKSEAGTAVATKQVLATNGDTLDNQHKDATTGTIGTTKEKYIADATGMFWKDGNDYKPLYAGEGADAEKVYTDEEKTTEYSGDRYKLNDQNIYTGYTNTRDGVIPTGVAMGIGGAAILIALAAVYFVIRKRNAAYED